MSSDPRDWEITDTGATPAPPDWLSRAVRDEIRPLLLPQRQAALEAWGRWLADHEDRERQRTAWCASQDEYLKPLIALPAEDPQRGPVPPAEGFVRVEILEEIDDSLARLIGVWVPAELSAYSGPRVEYPLPPPLNRDLSPDERWVALLAVHDAVRLPRERLGPAKSVPFLELCDRALRLTESHLPDLRRVVCEVSGSLPLDAGDPCAETPADGARLHFDQDTHTVTLDGEAFKIDNPRAFLVYRAVWEAHEPITRDELRGKVKGISNPKAVNSLRQQLPHLLAKTLRSGPEGFWIDLPPLGKKALP